MGATLLRVNLGNGRISKEPVAEALVRQFIGGRGLATKLLADGVDARIDPFDPANPLIFATGPLTGTFAPTGGRYMVVT
jgi:aldehyde:ferredoxin oxidoreductase